MADNLDIEDTWEIIHDAYLLRPENELEIYRKWIPILNDKLRPEKGE